MIVKEIAKEDVPNKDVPLVDAGNQRLDRLVNFRRFSGCRPHRHTQGVHFLTGGILRLANQKILEPNSH